MYIYLKDQSKTLVVMVVVKNVTWYEFRPRREREKRREREEDLIKKSSLLCFVFITQKKRERRSFFFFLTLARALSFESLKGPHSPLLRRSTHATHNFSLIKSVINNNKNERTRHIIAALVLILFVAEF